MKHFHRVVVPIFVCTFLVGCIHQPRSQDKQSLTELSPSEAVVVMKEFGTREVLVPTSGGNPISPGQTVRAVIVRNTILGVESKAGVTWDPSLVDGMVLDLVRAEESYSTNPERIGDWYVFGYRGVYGLKDGRRLGIWVNAKTGQVGYYEQLDPKPKMGKSW